MARKVTNFGLYISCWGTPLYKSYWYVSPQRAWLLHHFCLKMGIDNDRFSLKLGVVFEGTSRVY